MENAECLRTFVGHTSTVEGLTVTEEGSLFTGSSDYTAKRWRTLTKPEEMSLKATRRPLGRDLSDPAIGEEGEMGTYGGILASSLTTNGNLTPLAGPRVTSSP